MHIETDFATRRKAVQNYPKHLTFYLAMEDLIPIINQLQSVFKKTGMHEIKLPQIVVVGAQSSGKSSVLESLVKKSFLPRGTGIVTRCPIILQLNQIKKTTSRRTDSSSTKERSKRKGLVITDSHPADEWCRFSKTPEKIYTDFDEVRKAIEDLQVQMAGDKKGISMDPIILEVFSPNVIDLTVVDLPGIVKLALEGQPADIEEQVQNLIMKYIDVESAIILAVSAANADIATSESIKIAQKVDPDGNRTIAVVTKLDLVDKGTDVAEVLRGEVIKVKLGIIGVVNRSQQDINNNSTVEEAQGKEESFLKRSYPQIHAIGTPYLAKRLNQLLKEHIHKNLPPLIKRISDLKDENELKLYKLGKSISTKPEESLWIITDATNRFKHKFIAMTHSRPEYVGGGGGQELFAVNINEIFQKFRESIVVKEVSFATLQEQLKYTLNFEGFSSIEEVFKRIVKQGIEQMQPSAIKCARKFHNILSETAESCFDDIRLTYLNATIKRVLDELLEQQLKKVIGGIEDYIKIQVGMISSSDSEFVELLSKGPDESNPYQENLAKRKSTAAFPMSTGPTFCGLSDPRTAYTMDLIAKYLNVIKRELGDYIPKYCMFHLADRSIAKLTDEIKAVTSGKEQQLVSEPEEIMIQRAHTQELLKNLKEASKIIKDIRTVY